MDDLLMQNVVQYESKEEYIKCSIAATASCVTEGLPVHQPVEGRIKKINKSNDPVLKVIDHIFHEPANIQIAFSRCNPAGNYYFCRHLNNNQITINSQDECCRTNKNGFKKNA